MAMPRRAGGDQHRTLRGRRRGAGSRGERGDHGAIPRRRRRRLRDGGVPADRAHHRAVPGEEAVRAAQARLRLPGLGGILVSVGASYDYATEGGTHHAPGDLGALASISGFELLIPGHPAEVDRLLRATYSDPSPTYIRRSVSQNRRALDVESGRMEVVRRGSLATLIAVGPMLDRSLVAAEGLDVTVLYGRASHRSTPVPSSTPPAPGRSSSPSSHATRERSPR
jgi:hypothetical protein